MTEQIVEKCKHFFDEYTQRLIKVKTGSELNVLSLMREHSMKVAEYSEYLAAQLMMEAEECSLVGIIGLVQDLGRFSLHDSGYGQVPGDDLSASTLSVLDDAPFFAEMTLPEQQLVREVIEVGEKQAASPKDARSAQLVKILRDADKLDLWEVAVLQLKKDGSFKMPEFSLGLTKVLGVSEPVIKALILGKAVHKADIQTVTDFKLYLISLVYDLHSKPAFQIINQKQLIPKIYDSLPKRDDIINAYRQIRLYIENQFIIQ
jgi:hypothetical protein